MLNFWYCNLNNFLKEFHSFTPYMLVKLELLADFSCSFFRRIKWELSTLLFLLVANKISSVISFSQNL